MRIIIADDEELSLHALRRMVLAIDREDMELVGLARDGGELLDLIIQKKPDAVITDITMPGLNGLEVIAKTIELGMHIQFIITSAYANFEYARTAMRLGVSDFLPKPLSINELRGAVNSIAGPAGIQLRTTHTCSCIIAAARAYIDKNFRRPITLDSVAAHVFLSPAYFSALFKKETGIKYIDYLTGIRIGAAKQLLNNPQLTVTQIGEAVGYKDPKQFRKQFAKSEGISPSEYRMRGAPGSPVP